MIEIKQLTQEHLKDHHETICETYDALVPSTWADPVKLEQCFMQLSKQWTLIFAAFDTELDRIVWLASLLIEHKLIRWWVIAGHIEDVTVDKDYQDKWIWTKLLEHAVKEWEKAWCYKIILDCDPQYVGYYEKFWFENNWTFMRRYSKND